MESKQFNRRVLAVILLLAVMLTGMGATLYDLQIIQGEDYYQQSQRKISETETVEAARGQILDRNGRVLVSNEAVYQVTLDTSLMSEDRDKDGSGEDDRNDTLLSLIRIAREEEVDYADNLPISREEPFVFTTDQPYYTTSVNEAGETVRTLTRLGRFAVYFGWMDDPTKDPEEEPEAEEPAAPEEPGLWERIKAFFTGEDLSPAAPSAPEEEDGAPLTAEELLGKLCSYFEIKGAGAVDEKQARAAGEEVPVLNIGDMGPADARAVAGVLFELTYRARINTWPPYVFAEDVDIGFISRVKEAALAGVNIEATTVRRYHTAYAAHILGRVGLMDSSEVEYYTSLDEDGDGVPDYQQDDTVGKEGAEQAFESWLRGKSGVRTVERNAQGKVVSESWREEPEPGNNVVLTLDLDLQMAVEDILAAALPTLNDAAVEGAACVVLDVDTAEVLAAASYPTFNLATYGEDIAQNSADPLRPLFNRAFQGLYPPGSTFKPVTAVAALETGLIEPDTKIRDEGRYTYWSSPQPGCWIYNQGGGTHGLVDVTDAIEVSCNYFFYDVGRRLGIDALVDYAHQFGLGESTGVELPERTGAVGSPERSEALGQTWYEGNVLSVAIGQENTQVTPLQLANYIATLVNGGTRNAAHLLKEVKSSDFSQVAFSYEPEALSTIDIQPENLEAVKAGMLAVTTQGSVASAFRDLPVQVGAKTGTAQVSAQAETNAVFVCFAPYDDPEVAMAIAVEQGGSGSGLGQIAADILSYYFSVKETREEVLTENTLVR